MRRRGLIGWALFVCCAGAGLVQAQAVKDLPREAEPDYERIGRFIYAFHRQGVSRVDLDQVGQSAVAPPELAQRSRLLALEFDRIVQDGATAPDAEIKGVLREAALVGKAIEDWRGRASPVQLSAPSSASTDNPRPRSPS